MKEAEKRFQKLVDQAVKQVEEVIRQFDGSVNVDETTKVFDAIPRDREDYPDYERGLRSIMRGVFNAAANDEYLACSKNPNARADNGWADGCIGDEWESLCDCIACGQEAADQLLEEEQARAN